VFFGHLGQHPRTDLRGGPCKTHGEGAKHSPGQSPIRRSTHKKPPAGVRLPAKQLDYLPSPPASPPRTADPPAAAESPGLEIVLPPPGYCPPAQRPPPRGGSAPAPGRTSYNPTRACSFLRPTLSDWCLPIEFEQTLQYADLDLPSEGNLFTPHEEDDAELPSRFDRKAFLKLTLKKAYTILAHLGEPFVCRLISNCTRRRQLQPRKN